MATDKAITYLKNKAPKGEFLAYINKKEAAMLKKAGGSGELVNGIPSYRSAKGMASKARSSKAASNKAAASKAAASKPGNQNTGNARDDYRANYVSKGIVKGGGTKKKGTTGTNPNDYRDSRVSTNRGKDSRQEFIDKVNKDNRKAAAQNNTRFTPYSGGSRMQKSPGGLGNLLKLAIGGAFPGAGLLMGGLNKFGKMGEGIISLNDKIQNSDFGKSKTLMDYFNSKKAAKNASMNAGIDQGITSANADAESEMLGLQTQIMPKAKPTFSDPFANTVGTTTKVNAPSNDAVSSVARNYSGIEDYGVDINPQGIPKSIFKSLFPEGNLQDVIKNSKTQKDYNINATKDLVENLPGGVIKEAIAPALAGVLSPFYDGIQGIYRGATNPNKSILQALKDENIGSSMKERFTGAAAPLAERLANLNLSNPFISSAGAAEISPTKIEDYSTDVGLNTSGRLGSLSATVDAADILRGESVNPEFNYRGTFDNTLLGGQTNVYGNYSDDVQDLGLNFNNGRGLSGGISYDAITGEPRANIGFRGTFADGGLASMFTRRR